MIEIQDIFNVHIKAYIENHKLSLVQHKAVRAILDCRTAKLGGHIDTCPSCGFDGLIRTGLAPPLIA